MKKIFIIFLFFIFSFQSWTKAYDVREFEIEGISVGDSLLDHFPKELIEKEKAMDDDGYTNKDYFNAFFDGNGKFKIYEYLQIHLKSNDNNYIVQSVEGKIIYRDKIKECLKQKEIIAKDLKSIFPNAEQINANEPHTGDKTGQSFAYETFFLLSDNSGSIGVACYDWSEHLIHYDNLKVFIDSADFYEWLSKKAYK